MLSTVSRDTTIARRLVHELAEVENRYAAELLSDLPCVNHLLAHIERYRGKMLRPTLLLASGLACAPAEGELFEAHRVMATVVEMVHMGTLVHDDVLDEAEVRRKGATVNRLSDNETAVMLGDYLLSHAYHLSASLGDPVAHRVLSDATNVICEGELLQLSNRNNWALDERTYFDIIRRKTAVLCGACCRLGALLHGAQPKVIQGLLDYGTNVGIAFQIIDDVLDLVGDFDTVGKTLGRDIQKGKPTLPVIHALRHAENGQREALLELVTATGQHGVNGPLSATDASQITQTLRSAGSVDYARRRALQLVDGARAAIKDLPEGTARTLLLETAQAIVSREN